MKTMLAFLAALCLTITAAVSTTYHVHAQSSSKTIQVTAKRFAYEPAEITLKKGEPVTLVIKTEDVAHGLKFRELNLDTKIQKGTASQLSFTPDKIGDFVGHCSIFCGSGHGAMTLTLHVVQ